MAPRLQSRRAMHRCLSLASVTSIALSMTTAVALAGCCQKSEGHMETTGTLDLRAVSASGEIRISPTDELQWSLLPFMDQQGEPLTFKFIRPARRSGDVCEPQISGTLTFVLAQRATVRREVQRSRLELTVSPRTGSRCATALAGSGYEIELGSQPAVETWYHEEPLILIKLAGIVTLDGEASGTLELNVRADLVGWETCFTGDG